MIFRFACLRLEHPSGRVTLTPIEHPQLTVHASSAEAARQELLLGLSDRIERTHPARLIELVRFRETHIRPLAPEIMPVFTDQGSTPRELPLVGLMSPVHRPYEELFLPSLDLRLWLTRGQSDGEAGQGIMEQVSTRSTSALLAGRQVGVAEVEILEVEASPISLTELTTDELNRPNSLLDDARTRARTRARAKRSRKAPPTVVLTPHLDRTGTALHDLAREDSLDRAYEREAELTDLTVRLLGTPPLPVVLVGPSGVGKTALIHELVRRWLAEDARERASRKSLAPPAEPREPRDEDDEAKDDSEEPAAKRTEGPRAFYLDGPRWISGLGFSGDWEQQTLACLEEAKDSGALLHLGHVIEILDAGKSAFSDRNVAELVGPALLRRECRAVAEATPEEWARLTSRSRSLARAFSVIELKEPSRAAVQSILTQRSRQEATTRGIEFSEESLQALRALVQRFMPYGSVLGQSVAMANRLALDADARRSASRARSPGKPPTLRLGTADVVRRFSAESGIPEALLRDDQALSTDDVRRKLESRVMGQPAAVERLVETIATIKAGLSQPQKPAAVLFFAGPTGVGKTELAKALTEVVFGSEKRLVRLDMGEYAGPDALERLIGVPGDAGALIAAIRRQPFSVLLLDEFEKAHPAVFDALLGVFGEGRLSDADGQTTDFRSAILVLTSNLGADTLRAKVGFGQAGAAPDPRELRRHYLAEAERFFRPELLGRIDEVVVFSPLGPPELQRIVLRQLALVKRRDGLTGRHVQLEVTASAAEWLADHGYDPRYGARPLKRTLERELIVPLARVLTGRKAEHSTAIRVEAREGALHLETTLGSPQAAAARQRLNAVVEDAAALRRALVVHERSPWVSALQRRAALFTRQSKHPAYWKEHALAEAESSAQGRISGALTALTELREQTEELEELAYEVFHERALEGAVPIEQEVERLTQSIKDVEWGLFTAPQRIRGGITLHLTPGKGARTQGDWLLESYRRWLSDRGIPYELFWVRFETVSSSKRTKTPVAVPAKAAPTKATPGSSAADNAAVEKGAGGKTPVGKPAPGKAAPEKGAQAKSGKSPEPAATKKNAPSKERQGRWIWQPAKQISDASDQLEQWVLSVKGEQSLGVLSLEMGYHRFQDGSDTRVVSVGWEPRVISLVQLRNLTQLMVPKNPRNVRQVGSQGRLRDERTGKDYPTLRTHFDLEPTLVDAVRAALAQGPHRKTEEREESTVDLDLESASWS